MEPRKKVTRVERKQVFPPTIIQYGTDRKKITQAGMSINLKKALALINNPIDQQLSLFSSNQPEAFGDIDIKMMSKLDKLKKLNEMKKTNVQLKNKLDKMAQTENRIVAKNKSDELRTKIEQEVTEKINKTTTK